MNASSSLARPSHWVLALMVLLAGLSRLLPHAWNFTPVEAMALFGGAYFAQRWLAVVVPLFGVLLSDIAMGMASGGIYSSYFFSASFFAVYLTIALSAVLGFTLRGKVGVVRVAGAGLAGSLLFFLITNLTVWATATDVVAYPACTTGLVECYVAAIPFLRGTVLGTAVWSLILFGSFELLRRRYPQLRAQAL